MKGSEKKVREKKDLLSKEFKAACEIFELSELKNEKVWFTKLSSSLSDEMSGSTLLKVLKFLTSWGIVKSQFGETDTGRAGRLLYISGEDNDTIRDLYEKYWKDR